MRFSQEMCPECGTRKVHYEILKVGYAGDEWEVIDVICDVCLEKRLCHLKQPKSQKLLCPIPQRRDNTYER